MGIYAVTGGTKGIGEKTAEILRAGGHEVINIDIDGGDINADLGTAEGRSFVISEMHSRCSGGLDGLVCNAGISAMPGVRLSKVLSVNYFGSVAVAEGLYDLLKMKRGNCAVTVSATIAYMKRGKYCVDELLNNCGDEQRIGRLVDSFDAPQAGNMIYISTKIALARWVRRVSASWAARGVSINAVAPGAVDTTIMGDSKSPDEWLSHYPMPTLYGENRFMYPADVASMLAFLASPGANGMSGSIIICDSGTAAVFDTEKYC